MNDMPWIRLCLTCYENVPDGDELLHQKCIKPIIHNEYMTYADFLKMNPYHGMPVTGTINGTEIQDAKLSKDENERWFVCQNVETETPRTIDDVLATLSEEDRKIVEEEIK